MKRKKEKQTIILLCVIILIILCGSFLTIVYRSKASEGGSEGRIARIYQNQKLVREIDLSGVEEIYHITVCGDDGQENVIEVRQGEIGMISASCPDQICVDMGFIHTNSIPITCMPNQVVIEIVYETGYGDMDAVAY